MANQFKNRCFGAVIIKSVNSNWNADFTHSPRTLPDGTVYATDKALKYAIRNYIKKNYTDEKVFFFKKMKEDIKPVTLDENYVEMFGELKKPDKKSLIEDRKKVISNLLNCIDIRLFGATFASKGYNFSLHGPLQINHAIDKFGEFEIYSEQIMSPFRNSGKDDSDQSTLGNQTNLKEGHYVYHFSINPSNLYDFYALLDESSAQLSDEDIDKLIEAMNSGVTILDSSRKIGSENEATIFVKLKADSKAVLPSFTDFIDIKKIEDTANRTIDLTALKEQLDAVEKEIESVYIYYNPLLTKLEGLPDNSGYNLFNIVNGKKL